jgi:ABC-type nitrate/sulfonate/bicarbonate transport system substrate-binding protein
MSISRRSLIKLLTYAVALPWASFSVVSCTATQQQKTQAVQNVQATNQLVEKPISIRIAYPSGMNGQIAKTMEKAEIAKKQGLDAKFTFFQYGPPMMEALASGDVDAVITSFMPATNFLSRNPGKAIVVANLGNSSYSLMVPQNSVIQKTTDLKDKKIAVSFGSDSHLDLLRLLKQEGLNAKSDVKLLNTKPDELQLAFEQKFADAIVIRQPQVLKMQEKYKARIVQTWPFRFVSIMRSDFLKENPQARERYVAALQKSILFTAANKEQASTWFSEQLRLDPATIRRVSEDDPNYKATKLEDVSVEITPEVKKMLEDWSNFALESGMIKKQVDWGWK